MATKKFNESAEKYAKPHTMSGKKVTAEGAVKAMYQGLDPNKLKATDMSPRIHGTYRVSAGDPGANDVKGDGIVTRGNGAATKGTKARGPMA